MRLVVYFRKMRIIKIWLCSDSYDVSLTTNFPWPTFELVLANNPRELETANINSEITTWSTTHGSYSRHYVRYQWLLRNTWSYLMVSFRGSVFVRLHMEWCQQIMPFVYLQTLVYDKEFFINIRYELICSIILFSISPQGLQTFESPA